jgi:hypothetical protein
MMQKKPESSENEAGTTCMCSTILPKNDEDTLTKPLDKR